MFTGIIVATGRVTAMGEQGGDLELAIDAAALDPARIAIGDSISVQGVCLTVTRLADGVSLRMFRAKPWPRPRSAPCSRARG